MTHKEFKELEHKAWLVVLRDNKGEEHISKIVPYYTNGQLFATDAGNELHKGDSFVLASSCNPLNQQKITIQ